MIEIVIAAVAIMLSLATTLYAYHAENTGTEHPSVADYYWWMFPM